MKIIVDAMGGDNAPQEIVKGTLEAAKIHSEAQMVLVGDKSAIESAAAECGMSLDSVEIVHTDVAVTMEDEPTAVIRDKRDSSMSVGLRMLKESGDAFVSAGNTGALQMGSSIIIRPMKGIQRSSIATILPLTKPTLLMDSGANINVTPEYLTQWAELGYIYMKHLFGIENPAVGLLNNGTEEHKGTQLQIDTYAMLKNTPGVNFVGNIESREIPFGACDVLVTDGFTGNIVLKLAEGMGKFMMKTLKGMYTHNVMTKMSFLVMKDQLGKMKKQFDSSEYGGAPLLGLNKAVIKAHGSSNAKAIRNAIKQAVTFTGSGAMDDFAQVAKRFKAEADEKQAAAKAAKLAAAESGENASNEN